MGVRSGVRIIPLIKGIYINTLVGEMLEEHRVVVAVITEAMYKQHACLGCIPRHLPRFGVQLDAVVRLVRPLEGRESCRHLGILISIYSYKRYEW